MGSQKPVKVWVDESEKRAIENNAKARHGACVDREEYHSCHERGRYQTVSRRNHHIDSLVGIYFISLPH